MSSSSTGDRLPLSDTPCPRCLPLAYQGRMNLEGLGRLPDVPDGVGPTARDGSGPCCQDCATADALLRAVPQVPGFAAARCAVANDRGEQYRLPGVPKGLVQVGIMAPSREGDFEEQLAWLERAKIVKGGDTPAGHEHLEEAEDGDW